jgi:hypothetical protein
VAEGRVRVRARTIPRPVPEKPLLVFSHHSSGVDAAAQKRSPAVVIDKRVARDDGPLAGGNRPQAIIIALEAADAALLVEQADRVDLRSDSRSTVITNR